MIKLWY